MLLCNDSTFLNYNNLQTDSNGDHSHDQPL